VFLCDFPPLRFIVDLEYLEFPSFFPFFYLFYQFLSIVSAFIIYRYISYVFIFALLHDTIVFEQISLFFSICLASLLPLLMSVSFNPITLDQNGCIETISDFCLL